MLLDLKLMQFVVLFKKRNIKAFSVSFLFVFKENFSFVLFCNVYTNAREDILWPFSVL